MTELNRRNLLRVAALPLLASPGLARAQTREFLVGGPGSITTPLRQFFIQPFERKYNCTVLFEGTRSFTNIEKMRANRARQTMSVVMMDDPVMITAMEEGLLEKMTPAIIPNLSRLVPSAIHEDGAWINHMFPRAAIAYNVDSVRGGVTTWQILWEPRWRRRIAIPSLEMTQGIWTLMAATHLATGLPMSQALQNIDAGFEYLARLKPNLLLIYNNTAQAMQLLEQGEVAMVGGEVAHTTLSRKQAGMPVDMGRPHEGSFAMPNGIALVKDAPNRELACAFINEFLTDEYQYRIAERLLADPTVASAPLPAGFVRDPSMHVPDWGYINQHRTQWIDRWARTIAS